MNRRIIQVLFSGSVLLALILGDATVTAAPHDSAGKWWGDYFDSKDLSGGPVLSRSRSRASRKT